MSTEADEVKRKIAEEKAALRQDTSQGSAETFPLPAPPQGPTPNSALPPPGGNANATSAPLSQGGANESQGGGADPGKNWVTDSGTVDENVDKLTSTQMLDAATTSVNATGNTGKTAEGGKEAAKAKRDMNKQVEKMTGEKPRKTLEEFQKMYMKKLDDEYAAKQITKKQYKGFKEGWKNIFNVIPEEDFGLFLMDFGLRMMMAGEEGTSVLGAMGEGGLGALQGSQARQREQEAGALARTTAGQEAGLEAYKAETGRMEAETRAKRADASGAYQGEKVWLHDFFVKAGKSEEWIADYFARVKPPEQRRQDLRDALLRIIDGADYTQTDPIIGKKYRDFEKGDIDEWIETQITSETKANAVGSALSKYGDNE